MQFLAVCTSEEANKLCTSNSMLHRMDFNSYLYREIMQHTLNTALMNDAANCITLSTKLRNNLKDFFKW